MTRIWLTPRDISALQKDGMGWGHDLYAGCMHVDAGPLRRRSVIDLLRVALTRKEG